MSVHLKKYVGGLVALVCAGAVSTASAAIVTDDFSTAHDTAAIDAQYAHKPSLIASTDGRLHHFYCAVRHPGPAATPLGDMRESRGITVATQCVVDRLDSEQQGLEAFIR